MSVRDEFEAWFLRKVHTAPSAFETWQAAYRAALEQAAKVCDDMAGASIYDGTRVAAAIRAMKDTA